MRIAADAAILASVCVLLIVVIGSVQTGPIPVSSRNVPSFLSFLGSLVPIQRSSIETNRVHTSGMSLTTQTTGLVVTMDATTEGGTTNQVTGILAWATPANLEWFVLIPTVVILGVGVVALLLRRENPKVFDLKAAVEEMGAQRSYFMGSWTRKDRNAALLRYYVLMAETCAKAGIYDGPSDTPQEFILRASELLSLDLDDSALFAYAVDRAHYGEELPDKEIGEVSKFMDVFTNNISGKVGVG